MQWLREKPGFNRAYALLRSHPDLFVLANRFIYGMRAVGGVVAGLSGIPIWRFLLLNTLSAAVWTALFTGLGYVFGLGAETILGETLQKHHRVLLAAGIGLALLLLGHWAARRLIRAGRASRNPVRTGP